MSMWRTPRCETASITALCTAGVAPIVPDSPIPLAPSGLTGVGVSISTSSNDRQLGRGRHAVGHQVGVLRVAVLVVAQLLEQRLGDPGGHAAVDLALGDQRVDDRAGVVDRDQALQVDRAGLGVDLDHRHVGAERERRLGGGEVGLGAQLGQPSAGVEPRGELAPVQPGLGRAGDVEAAELEVEHHVLGARPRARRRPAPWRARPAPRRPGRRRRRRSGSTWTRRCRCRAATASVSPLITVIFSIGRPMPLGDDLRERRLVTLALGEGAGADDRLAVGRDLDRAELGLVDPVGDLDIGADADPELEHVTALAALGLLAAQLLVAGASRAPGRARPRSRRCRSARPRRSSPGRRPWR